MGLCASLVRQFETWITSSASKTVTAQAEKASAKALAEVASMEADRLTLSGLASKRLAARAESKVATPIAPTTEQLLQRRRVAMNRINGDRREAIVQRFLRKRFPEAEGFSVHAEQYLRDKQGRIALEEASGHSRRLDFVVFQGEKVVSTVEVTSKTASKVAQSAKEAKIRAAGGRYLIHPGSGKLVRLPASQQTAVLRLE